MSHGIARSSRARTEEQKRVEQEKIQRYRDLEDQVRRKIASRDYTTETFNLTSKLLRQNPEYYTIWNVRRRCLTSTSLPTPSDGSSLSKASLSTSAADTYITSSDGSLQTSSTSTPNPQDPPTTGKSGTTHEEVLETIRSELVFTVPLLMDFPKCYWIWNHRSWILGQASEQLRNTIARRIWEEELGLVSKMLSKDQRNFHAWGYRRHVVKTLEALSGKSMVEDEFEYTNKMVRVSLSNFSAWHNRSQLIPRLLEERKADDALRKRFLDEEVEKLRGGLNVAPEDQSLWFYHQYLLSNITDKDGSNPIAPNLTDDQRITYLDEEIEEISDLLEDYQDIKWIYEALLECSMAKARIGGNTGKPNFSGEFATWLSKLKELDPKRKGRWDDIAQAIQTV